MPCLPHVLQSKGLHPCSEAVIIIQQMLIDHLFNSLRNVCSHLFSVLFQPIDLWTQNPYNLQHSVCACESISHQKTPTRFSSDFCRRAEALCLDCSAFSQLSWNELVYKEFTSSLGRTGSLGGALFGPTSRPALARSPRAQHCWSPGWGLNLALPLSSGTLLCLIYHLNHLKDLIS